MTGKAQPEPDAVAVNDVIAERFASRLRALRANRGWSLSTLASATGLSKGYLSRMELAERQPSLGALVALARAYDVPVGHLVENPPAATVVTRSGRYATSFGSGRNAGTISSGSGVLTTPFAFGDRTTEGATTPEELLASAQAACAAMSLNHTLTTAGYPPQRIEVDVTVTMEVFEGADATLQAVDIMLHARVPRISAEEFSTLALQVAGHSPIAKALGTLDVRIGSVLIDGADDRAV